jgi:macrodomain Ter protein organizer (MatP/YcbG family)
MSTTTPHIYIRMTPELQRDAKRLAHRRETTLSDLVRQLIKDAAQCLEDDPEAALRAELAALREELEARKRERAKHV